MIVSRERIIKAYRTAMQMHPDREEAIAVVAAIFGHDVDTVRAVVEQDEEEASC